MATMLHARESFAKGLRRFVSRSCSVILDRISCCQFSSALPSIIQESVALCREPRLIFCYHILTLPPSLTVRKQCIMKAMQIRAARRFLHSMLPVYVGSWEPSRTEMYRQVIIASHRYAFTPPAIALVE
jgi:hypothetical protein